ncbi:MAG TPA: hypothetical protein VKY74_19210, partial [Chloroflexia bacterium]|nr:hypothetical protein [Chloroflexia bacterium]
SIRARYAGGETNLKALAAEWQLSAETIRLIVLGRLWKTLPVLTPGPCLRPVRSRAARFWAQVERTPTCWHWRGDCDARGYGRFARTTVAHAAWELTRGPVPAGVYVRQTCNDRGCVCPAHLALTPNAAGRGPRKLTADQVRAIRAEAAAGQSQAQLAAAYHVGQTTVSAILRGTRWAWLR